MCHLKPDSLVAAFDVETLVRLRAVKNCLHRRALAVYYKQLVYQRLSQRQASFIGEADRPYSSQFSQQCSPEPLLLSARASSPAGPC